MKWIVIVIVACIVPYTFVTLHYRKPEPAFQPYQDMKNRANTARLLSAGYQRISLPAELPADPLGKVTSAWIENAEGGLPSELTATVIQPPLLPVDITRVSAPPEVASQHPYSFRFACTLPDEKRQLAGADLYLKGNDLIVTPDYEKLSGGLLTRTRDNIIQLTIPAGVLKPGDYRVRLIGQSSSRAWTLAVK